MMVKRSRIVHTFIAMILVMATTGAPLVAQTAQGQVTHNHLTEVVTRPALVHNAPQRESSATYTEDFDTAANWLNISGSSLAAYGTKAYTDTARPDITSYYAEVAMRQTATVQDGFPGARSGAYAWRLRDADGSFWRAQIAGDGVGDFSVWVRRWDGSPDPDYVVEVSIDNGAAWTTLHTINNAWLEDSSDWKEVTGTINTDNGNAIDDTIIIQIRRLGGERLMIDDFSMTTYSAGITLAKTVIPTTEVAYHSAVTYTLMLENSMTITDTVLLTDTLPAEVTFGTWIETPPAGTDVTGDVITWNGALAASTTLTFTFTAIHVGDYGDVVTNTATFSGTTQSGTATATFATIINDILYDVAVAKTALADEVYVFDGAGALVAYTVEIDNVSVISATEVLTLHDRLPAGFVYVSDDSGVAPNEDGGILTWVFDTPLDAGETLSFTLALSATDAITVSGMHVNAITLEVEPADRIAGNNVAEAGVMVYRAVPIAVARAGSNNEVFALEGRVTAQNGTWNNAPEWVFQDASGGIAAFFTTDPPVVLGDTVRLVARRGSFNNQEQMVTPVRYFESVAAGPPVMPITYTTGQVATGISEGWLVEIEGIVANMPATCGTAYNITLNDGSGVATVRIEAATGINLCNLGIQNGDRLGVAGFSTQFQTTYQVKPRNVGDLTLFVDAPLVLSTLPTNNATHVVTDTLITIHFNETVTATNTWNHILCSQSGVVTATGLPAGPSASYTLTPAAPFAFGEICHVTVLADQITNAKAQHLLADYRFNFTVGPAPSFGACDDAATPVHFIQGSGDATPILGTTVVVEAVVVGAYQGPGQFSGFFLQERDERVDDDPMTSEGIFVFHGATPVAPGDLVRVRGAATEFNGLTQIASVSNVTICGTMTYTVTPATMTLPVDDMMAWEAVEGMLVSFAHDLVVTEHYRLGRFGELQLSVSDRLWNPTNVITPGLEALALQDLNDRSRVRLDDGSNVQNPDPVIYPYPKLTYTNTLRTGALVHDLMGVVDFRSNSYRIQPVGVVSFTNTAARPLVAPDVGGTLKVASFNVLNYFTTLDTGAPICGPLGDMGCRGANTALEFGRQRAKIINAILEMDADIIGLIEMENHADDTALKDLVAGLNATAGPGTYDYIDTGVIGTDAIKLAFIYQPATVTPVGDYALLDSNVDARFLDTKNRPVLIQTFTEHSSNGRVTVAVNHLKSKGSPCDDVGDPDMNDGQGNCNLTRTNAAAAMMDFLATDPTGSGSPHVLIIGDLNAYAMEDPITTIRDAGYTDLLRQFYGDAAYTYVFDGQFGHLDYALASPALMPFVTGATAWHINADEPIVLDYNTEFKSAQQITEWYSPEPFRSSDHDPVIVGLNLGHMSQLTLTKSVTPTVDVSPGDAVTYTLTLHNSGEIPLSEIVMTDALPWQVTFDGWIVQDTATESDNVITWDGAIDGGATIIISFRAVLRTDTHFIAQPVVNTATYTVGGVPGEPASAAFNVQPVWRIFLPLTMRDSS